MIPGSSTGAFEFFRRAMNASPVDVTELGIEVPAVVLR